MESYDKDIVAWAGEQAQLLRARSFDNLDIEHIAAEIEDVGKSEQRELARRMAHLLSHLLLWSAQPYLRRTASAQRIISEQRKVIKGNLIKCPSLESVLGDDEWQSLVWADAVISAVDKSGLENFPTECPWLFQDQVLMDGWLPA